MGRTSDVISVVHRKIRMLVHDTRGITARLVFSALTNRPDRMSWLITFGHRLSLQPSDASVHLLAESLERFIDV